MPILIVLVKAVCRYTISDMRSTSDADEASSSIEAEISSAAAA
jgi:hypothetical protein